MVGFRQQGRVTLQRESERETAEKMVYRQIKYRSEDIKIERRGNRKGGDTDRYIGVFVENDLKEVRREYRRGFEMLLGSEDVLLLPIWTRRGAGQICKHITFTITLLTGFQGLIKNLHCKIPLFFINVYCI